MDERINQLEAESQSALIEFLSTSLDLAFTMLQTAEIEAGLDDQAIPDILQKVHRTLGTVRAFTGRIQDQTIGAQIHSRTNKLEAALAESRRCQE